MLNHLSFNGNYVQCRSRTSSDKKLVFQLAFCAMQVHTVNSFPRLTYSGLHYNIVLKKYLDTLVHWTESAWLHLGGKFSAVNGRIATISVDKRLMFQRAFSAINAHTINNFACTKCITISCWKNWLKLYFFFFKFIELSVHGYILGAVTELYKAGPLRYHRI